MLAGTGETTVGQAIKLMQQRGEGTLIYKGWDGLSGLPTLDANLRASSQTSPRWFGGMPLTSLSPSYSGKGGYFSIIKVPPKGLKGVPDVRKRFQPHLSKYLGLNDAVYEGIRSGRIPYENGGHFAIGNSPDYELVLQPQSWKSVPKLPHKTYRLGKYDGGTVSGYRTLDQPLPQAVSQIPLYTDVIEQYINDWFLKTRHQKWNAVNLPGFK